MSIVWKSPQEVLINRKEMYRHKSRPGEMTDSGEPLWGKETIRAKNSHKKFLLSNLTKIPYVIP